MAQTIACPHPANALRPHPPQRIAVSRVFREVVNLVGIAAGSKGLLGEYWNLLGNQGWEFVEMGKLFIELQGFFGFQCALCRNILPKTGKILYQ